MSGSSFPAIIATLFIGSILERMTRMYPRCRNRAAQAGETSPPPASTKPGRQTRETFPIFQSRLLERRRRPNSLQGGPGPCGHNRSSWGQSLVNRDIA